MSEPINPKAFTTMFAAALKSDFGPRSFAFAFRRCSGEITSLRMSGVTWDQIGKSINDALATVERDPVSTDTMRSLYSKLTR